MMTGPSGSWNPFCLIPLRYSRVVSAWPIAREVRYIILYPLRAMSV